MKSMILVALALVAVVVAVPAEQSLVNIVRSEFNSDPEGSYTFGFENSDRNTRNEVGVVKEALDEENKPHSVIVVRGSFSYVDENGKVESVNYIADETGYHAEGDSIPKV